MIEIIRPIGRSEYAKLLFLFDNYALDTDRRELHHAGAAVAVEPQVFDLLAYLLENRERVASKDDLIAAVWCGRVVSDSALTTRINAARCAIGDTGAEQRLIRTFARKGLRFVGAVREQAKPEAVNVTAPAGAATQQPKPELSLPDKPSVAVLPFSNMSGNPEEDYFADGMAEEIITALSRCAWLFVIARNSSFTYKSRAVDVRQVGRELGVRYVLEGSVRRAGNRLRFTGQLIDSSSGAHIWADRFEGTTSDVFDLQDQFTASVVAAIEPKLQLAEIERMRHKPTTNLAAYDLVLRAQQLADEFTAESTAAALRHLEQALAIDPDYAAAMALAAFCRAQLVHQGWVQDREADAKEGLRLVSRAIELGKDDGNVFWMAACAVLHLQMDLARARELAYRSLELNPHSAVALATAGRIEVYALNDGKALELLYRAERLSPREPRGWLITMAIAYAHVHAGRFDEGISLCRRTLNQNPRNAVALRALAVCLVKQGRQSEAAQVVREVLAVEPQLTLTKLRARAMYLNAEFWSEYSAALRIAGIPE
jgi:TolB-like protein/Flp pilus assembly protein TadD